MPVQGVQDEQLGVINTPPRPVSKLKRIRLHSVTARMRNLMISFNVFITRELSAIGRKSLGSFGLSFLGIGITVESFQMSGMVHVSTEV